MNLLEETQRLHIFLFDMTSQQIQNALNKQVYKVGCSEMFFSSHHCVCSAGTYTKWSWWQTC